LGQGGNGGNILTGCRAYLAVGGNGSFSDQARTALPALFGDADYLYTRFRVWAGNGGYGYEDCEGCPGGDGGNAGTATAIGGKGGDVLGEAIQSIGGDGGDTWGIVRGRPGDGGNGNPAGKAGGQPFDPPLFDNPGEGGNGTTVGPPGETLGFDALKEMAIDAHNGETCGEEAECEYDDMEFPTDEESCRKEGAGFVYKVTEITTNANSMSETIINIIGTYVEEGCGGSSCFMCDRTRTQTITYTDGREPRIYTTNGTGLCSTMISPFCTQDGQLFYPAGNSSVSYSSGESTQITVSFTGCYADEQAPRTCCQGEDGRYYFWGDDTCPE